MRVVASEHHVRARIVGSAVAIRIDAVAIDLDAAQDRATRRARSALRQEALQRGRVLEDTATDVGGAQRAIGADG